MRASGKAAPTLSHPSASSDTPSSVEEEEYESGARVLLAEDNAVNQEVGVALLESHGYQVDLAKNGLEALKALSRKQYAAVFMDCQMPRMDGYEATKEIRRREAEAGKRSTMMGRKMRHIPIIAMTAHALQGEREKCLAAGMEDYISKPVNPEELEVMLGRWIPQSAPASENPTPETDGATTTISTTNGAIDHSVLTGLRKIQQKSKSDFLERLIEVFLSEVPSKLAALREGATRGEAQALEQRAHNLKGSSASLGALHMASICGELEALAQSGDLKSVPDLLAQLNAEFDRVRQALSSAQLRRG